MTKAAELAKMGEVLTNSQIGGRRNIIINGAMQVAQRSTSAVTGLGAANGYFTLDRMRHVFGGSTAGRLTSSQSTDAPSGFGNSLKWECTTPDASIAAGEYLMLQHKIEAQNLQPIKKGTSDAEEVTVSFYVKGNASATYALELYDNDNNRQCSKLFSVTTSWTRVILTYPADTTGAFGNDNDVGLSLTFWLHAGTTFTSGTLNSSAFAASSNSSRATGISSFFDSTDRTFFITGIQMEVGSQATPFEHRSFGEELALCQRYYYRTPRYINSGIGANESIATGNMDGSTVGAFLIRFPQLMRDAPTAFEQSGTASHYSVRVTSDANGTSVPTSGDFMSDSAFINLTASGAGFTSGDGAFLRIENTSAFLAWSAEL
jgi:hypothetical protein